MSTGTREPSRAGYVIAIVLFLVGAVVVTAVGIFVVLQFMNLDESLERVVVPGTAELELEDTGRYTIFYEYRSAVDGRDFDTGSTPPDLDVRLTSLETGEEIPVSSTFGDTTYETWNRAGESIMTFRIDEPGHYELSAEYVTGAAGPEVVLAIGEGVGTRILLSVAGIFGSGILFCVLTVIAAIIVLITLVRRNRASQPTPRPTDVPG